MNGQRSRAELQALHGSEYVRRFPQSDQGRLSRLVPLMHLEPGMVVADLGCGNGLLLEQVHTQVHRYDGVDFSPEFIDQARDRQKLAQITNAEFHQESIETFLKQRLNRYDRIFAMDFSEHVYDEQLVEILSAARRALKQEGRVFLHTPNLSFFLERLKDWRVLKQFPEHVRVRTPDGNASILHRAGFSQVQVRYLPHYLPALSWIHVFSRIPWLGRCLRARLFIEARP